MHNNEKQNGIAKTVEKLMLLNGNEVKRKYIKIKEGKFCGENVLTHNFVASEKVKIIKEPVCFRPNAELEGTE